MDLDESLVQKAYEAIKEKILIQELKPGSPIVETEFADKLGMSRTPLRDAIRRLQADGLVEVIPRKGTFIKNMTLNEIVMCYEVSEALEGMLAYHIASKFAEGKGDDSKIDKLNDFIDKMDQYYKNNDIKCWVMNDENFHETLYELCDNIILVDYISRIKTQFNCVSWFFTPRYIDRAESNVEHRELVHYIAKGDTENARSVAQRQRKRIRIELEKFNI